MPRKVCSSCKKLNGGSAVACECGYVFEAASIVKRQTTKSCPSCRVEQPRLLEVCGCDHRFEDITAMRQRLSGRVHLGWSYAALGTLGLAACIAITVATSGSWIVFSFGGLILALRGLMMRADALSAIRVIDAAASTLPTAKRLR